MAKLESLDREVQVLSIRMEDHICSMDIARYKYWDATDALNRNWQHNRNTGQFPGIEEQLNNPGLNPIEFGGIRKEAGQNSFIAEGQAQLDCLRRLNRIAIRQMRILTSDGWLPRLDMGMAGGDA